VRPGVNDEFKAADLDIELWLGRFEVESREVFAARHAVVAALGLTPGLRVADVGAGTGLYTLLLSEAVGAEGWVYAIDIAPRFLEHILEVAAERRATNVTGVLCPETDIALPPSSVDLAFVCDTYHHFEFPVSTLRSIHRALAPGGRLVVLDFERIEGRSRPWVLEHVRAGKDATRAEIEAGGFEFVRELAVPGLAENYVIEFRRPRRPAAGVRAGSGDAAGSPGTRGPHIIGSGCSRRRLAA
jgi:SAM-dependent methyltransferase